MLTTLATHPAAGERLFIGTAMTAGHPQALASRQTAVGSAPGTPTAALACVLRARMPSPSSACMEALGVESPKVTTGDSRR